MAIELIWDETVPNVVHCARNRFHAAQTMEVTRQLIGAASGD